LRVDQTHVAITGHTGFKGSWLVILLKALGYKVSGVSLPPKTGSLFDSAELSRYMHNHVLLDILDREKLKTEFERISPDIVIHFAAQSLVRESYREPSRTFDVNFTGTLNLLLGIPMNDAVTLVITTDKVYRPKNPPIPHSENDSLGGLDPYSASKAAADLLVQSWMASNPQQILGIARAGNVIGGGDNSSERLFPDILDNLEKNTKIVLRNPDAIRPWQHVLDCLNGYLKMIDHMSNSKSQLILNFGPDHESKATVLDVCNLAANFWGTESNLEVQSDSKMKETEVLLLDSGKAMTTLNWRNKLELTEAVKWTVDWQKDVLKGTDAFSATERQVTKFLNL
jgi:CDP-glucose 4,6-dehydratase